MSKVGNGRLSDKFRYFHFPRTIWELSGLSSSKKLILAEIFALQREGACWASNAHLGIIIDASDRQVREHLTGLQQAGHLIIENRGGGSGNRKMWVSEAIAEGCRRDIGLNKPWAASGPDAETQAAGLSVGYTP